MITTATKVTRKQTKIHNKRLVLKTIYNQTSISRASVARTTHLTRPTVSSTVAELMNEGLVTEVGYGPSEGGKPPILLSVVDDSRHLIGIDLANSEFRGAVIDLRGNIIHRQSLPVNDTNGEAALALVYQLVNRLIEAASSPVLGIGIGAPGLMNPERGIVRKSVNLEWQDVPLRDFLEERYNIPVYIANDSQVAALAEYTFGDGGENNSLIVVKVGRGVGAGIVINSRLHYGDGYGAGEIGHVGVADNGKQCLCGHFGCLETVVSSRALINRAKAIAESNPGSSLNQIPITTDALLQIFEHSEELRLVITEMGRNLGRVVANLVGILNIKQVLIGGSLARFGNTLVDPLRQEMGRRVQIAQADETVVGIATLGNDIVILGAAALLLAYELGLV